jgi:hypothetical protein
MEAQSKSREPAAVGPNFFIVGAPRCGTTSLTRWLAQHPNIFMPTIKVPFHFATDLDMVNKRQFRDPGTYLDLFAAATTQRRIGESTPFYLYSRRAAREIKRFDPAARILVLLRNPVDMMYSMHARNLMDGNENIKDFAEALEAEPTRMAGNRLPKGCFFRPSLYYRDLVRFPEQLKRYMDLYDRDQLHVILFDDLKSNPRATFKDVVSFLGLEQELDVSLGRANKSVAVRSPALATLLREPPEVLQRLPKGLWEGLVWRLNRWNKGTTSLSPIDPVLRRRLLDESAEDIVALSQLLQRDLSHWLTE